MLRTKGQSQLLGLLQWAGSWTSLGHCSTDENSAQHRDWKSPAHCCGFQPSHTGDSTWRLDNLGPALQGQASHSKTERKGLLELVTKGSSWWVQESWGPLAPRQHIQEGAAIELMTLMPLVGRLQVTPGVSTTVSLTRSLGLQVRGLNWARCFSYLEENSN